MGLPDALGSVRQLVDPSVSITLAQSYEPFGSLLAIAGEAESAYGFAGEWTDATGLVHLRARYYEPRWGRFFQHDPWGGNTYSPATLNAYLYGLSNPVTNVDPSGEVVCRYGRDPATGHCKPRPNGLPWWLDTPPGPLGVVREATSLSPGSYLQYLIYGALLCAPYLAQYVWEAFPPGQWQTETKVDEDELVWYYGMELADQETEPERAPQPIEVGPDIIPRVTETPRPRENYVADSNIFMDRVEGGIAQRKLIDLNYLSNPDVILYIPASAVMEVIPIPSQLSRLRGFPGGARVIQVPNPNMAGIDVSNLRGRDFDIVDMIVLQTAKERDLPVLTTQEALRRQVYSNVPRRDLWGDVLIIRPTP